MPLTRRDFLSRTAHAALLAGAAPLTTGWLTTEKRGVRCINVVNFMRGVEPRQPTDLLLPVQKQLAVILEHNLPATWLLQFDALVSGPFVDFLKKSMPSTHEVGFWFEMNELLCRAAEVEWRGRAGYEWDSQPAVAFTIGYTEEERHKLVDAAMEGFKTVWGRYPSSVASWNLDSISMIRLSEKYGVDAFAVCRDQIATDGFTIWGAPIAGYYPSRLNCWSPALKRENQIHTPVFRMLGQDPVYYYNDGFPLPDGSRVHQPDTMEPVWVSGRSPLFTEAFLEMISKSPCMDFAYAQLGQENNFGWPDMEQAYPMQMRAMAQLRDAKSVHVETMGETGRRFKKSFAMTPVQAQVMLKDPYGNTAPAEQTIWYQSRFYRANLHFYGDLPYLRDITVYSDHLEQPFLTKPTRDQNVEQRMPAVIDGFHWSPHPGAPGEPDAGGFFYSGGQRLKMTGEPTVRQVGETLIVEMPAVQGLLRLQFDEQGMTTSMNGNSNVGPYLNLSFKWDPAKQPLPKVETHRIAYESRPVPYAVGIRSGRPERTAAGWLVTEGSDGIQLRFAQG